MNVAFVCPPSGSICDRLWENRTFGGENENLVFSVSLRYIKLPLK